MAPPPPPPRPAQNPVPAPPPRPFRLPVPLFLPAPPHRSQTPPPPPPCTPPSSPPHPHRGLSPVKESRHGRRATPQKLLPRTTPGNPWRHTPAPRTTPLGASRRPRSPSRSFVPSSPDTPRGVLTRGSSPLPPPPPSRLLLFPPVSSLCPSPPPPPPSPPPIGARGSPGERRARSVTRAKRSCHPERQRGISCASTRGSREPRVVREDPSLPLGMTSLTER